MFRDYGIEQSISDLPTLTPVQIKMLELCRWKEAGNSGVHLASKAAKEYPLEQWEFLLSASLIRRWPSGYCRLTKRGIFTYTEAVKEEQW